MGLLNEKVCLVTGAGRGIGKEIASLFALEGAVVYAADVQQDKLEEWVAQFVKNSNCIIIPISLDVTDSTAVKNTIMLIKKQQNRLDVLVNNAAIITYELLGMISKDTMRKMFEVNVFATIELMQYSSRLMERNNSGSIINIASIVGAKGAAGQLSYAASKGAVISATKSAAKELASKNIRVNAIAPGMISTDRFTSVMNEHFSDRSANIRMGRLGSPIDVAKACLFFASEQSEYVTGQVLGIDGCLVL
mgnify:CR=1 FL=1